MAKIAIKIDWLNMRVEFSPNSKIIAKVNKSATGGSEIDKTIFEIDANPVYESKKYQTYSVDNDKFDYDDVDPQDDTTTWWREFIDASGSQQQTFSQPVIQSNTSNIKQSSTVTSIPAPPPAKSGANELEKKKIEAQIDSIQKMVTQLDESFNKGKIDQDSFLKKKEFLGNKLGSLMGELEQL
jgi:hypothetical protein